MTENNKNIMLYSFVIIPAIFLLVVGGQGSARIVPTACNAVASAAWQKGYNDGQNDYKSGQPYTIEHEIPPFDDYRAGYSEGYVDARAGLSCFQ